MPTSLIWRSTRSLLIPRVAAIALASVLSLSLASLAAPAGASAAVAAPDVAQPLPVTSIPSAEVEEALSKVPLKDLPATNLSEVVSKLPGLGVFPQGPLREALAKTIEELEAQEGTLGALDEPQELISRLEAALNGLLSGELSSLLHGHALSSVLSEALGPLNARKALAELLGSASEPEQLTERVLNALTTGALDKLLGATLNGEPVSAGTVGELAARIGTTPEGLAQALGTTPSQLPASALALTAPLTSGKELAVLDAAEGVDLGTLGTARELLSEAGAGGPGGSGGGTGGTGGPGGSSSGASGGVTVLQGASSAQGAPSGSSAKPLGKVKIVSRRIKGKTATLVVQVPAAGTLAATGKGLRSVGRQTDRAERVTLRLVLTRASLASLRRRRHRLKVNLVVSFKPVSGAVSKATSTVAFP